MITVYSKYDCKNCKQTKRMLKFAHLEFVERNVQDDADALDFVKNELGFTNLPVIVAEGVEPFQYNKEKVAEFIKEFRK